MENIDQHYEKLHTDLANKYGLTSYVVGRIRSSASRGLTQDDLANIFRAKHKSSKKYGNHKIVDMHLYRLKQVTRMDEQTWIEITKPDPNDRYLGTGKIAPSLESTLKIESKPMGVKL